MATFLCKTGTMDGRILEKEFESVSAEQLKSDLEEQGLHVFSIQKKRLPLFSIQPSQRVTGRCFLAFNQEFLTLVRSGLSIVLVLDTLLEKMEQGSFYDAVSSIRDEIKAGGTLSDAFEKFPVFFPPLYVSAIRAGERTGDIPETLSRFMAYRKRIEAIKVKVRNASFYPIILTSAAVLVVVFLLLYVVPTFTQIYADAQVELPLMTRMLISFSKLLTGFWYVWLALIVGIFLAFKELLMSSRGRFVFDRFILSCPFISGLTTDYALSSYCRTLATTVDSGIPLVQSMGMCRGTVNNLYLQEKVSRAIRSVEEGGMLSSALEKTGFFPLLALRMINVGESSGSLTEMLGEVAEFYESEVEQRLSRLTTMIEPILMVVMGGLIAFIIVAMYVPIFQLAGTVG
nr:type II secretion system F family protein [uncultured Desulfuromonas sp.]